MLMQAFMKRAEATATDTAWIESPELSAVGAE